MEKKRKRLYSYVNKQSKQERLDKKESKGSLKMWEHTTKGRKKYRVVWK